MSAHPYRTVLADWAAANPRVRRVWMIDAPGAAAPAVAVEAQPVADSEETIAIWMAHCDDWMAQLRERIGVAVDLEWFDADGGTLAAQDAPDAVLVYERPEL